MGSEMCIRDSTYTVEDVCGRTASCDQIFTISNTPPVISCPLSTTVVCSAEIVVDTSNVAFVTSCGVDGSVSVSDPVIEGEPDCAGATYTYTYTVEDVCGRIISCNQVFTIENDAPVITCPADTVVTCAADIVVDVSNVSFTTSCDLGGTVSVSEPLIEGIADCSGATHTYTYTVEDACGRTASCDQVFTIENDAPTISCPADTIVLCAADIVLDTANIVFTVSCGLDAVISVSEPDIIGEPDCPGSTYVYTYTVEDPCGRMASCEQIFTIDDSSLEISCPSDATVSCEADIAVDVSDASFSTSCGVDGAITIGEVILDGTPNCTGTTYTYVYTAEDACGRTVSCEQIFTIENDPPMITSCPPDITVFPDDEIMADTSLVTFTISCDLGATVSVGEPVIVGEPDEAGTTYTYTYTVEDVCGRTTSCDQVFTISNDPPTIVSCPENTSVACAADITTDTDAVVFIANCETEVTITVEGPVIEGEPDCLGTTYTYTYNLEDPCGVSTCEQTFTISNDEPTITCLSGYSVVCASQIELGTPEFIASCGIDGTLSLTGPVIDGEPNTDGSTYTYTHTVTDACGRMASCEQVFTIANECYAIDFDFDSEGNALAPGTEIFDQYENFTITRGIFDGCAQLFDTGNPTGGDVDLGTPNEQYGGPGIGAGGASNTEFQGNALIISEDCGVPAETEGQLIFTFDCSVTIKTVDLLDINCDIAEIELYDANGNLLAFLPLPDGGVNGFYEYEVNTSGVYTMIIDLDCGGGVTGFTYCKDNTPGADCDANPSLCYDYIINHGECGAAWQDGDLSGTVELGDDNIDITISDPDNVLDNTQAVGTGLLVRSDPNDVDDEVIIQYDLSKSSEYVVFDIVDIDFKKSATGQQEAVCVYGTLGSDPTQILPDIRLLDGSVIVNGNCAEGGASSAASGQDESILVEFTECIDKITIVYGSGSNSPTPDPDNSKIIIGGQIFEVEQCGQGCECLADDDNDGVCNDEDVCPGGDDSIDSDGDGTPDDCELQCDEYTLDFRVPGYDWSGHGEVESYTVGNQTFDMLITDGNNIIESTYDFGAGLAIVTDATSANEEYVITYNLSEVANGVTFDIVDLDFSEGQQQEQVCIYATLGDDPTQILPTITPLSGSVAVDGNCAVATVNSTESLQLENVLVEFTECINQITIVYGTGPDASIQDPSVGNIIIGSYYGFITEVCEDVCPELRVEEEAKANITLYPNPVYGSGNITLEIDTDTRGDAQIILVDALGRIISVENIQLMNNFTRHEISVDALSAGMYFVQMQTKEWRTDGSKFIVVKP